MINQIIGTKREEGGLPGGRGNGSDCELIAAGPCDGPVKKAAWEIQHRPD